MPPVPCLTRRRLVYRGAEHVMHTGVLLFAGYPLQFHLECIGVSRGQFAYGSDSQQLKSASVDIPTFLSEESGRKAGISAAVAVRSAPSTFVKDDCFVCPRRDFGADPLGR